MLGIVCIHAFNWASPTSHGLWALSSPSLIGFMMISGWFGIHFKPMKLVRMAGVVITCFLVGAFMADGDISSLAEVYRKGYWYIWAYIFVMLLSPVVDGFVEHADRRSLLTAFFTIGPMFWIWSFFAQQLPAYVPTVSGFGDCSGVILFCVYILIRLIRKLGWSDWLLPRRKMLLAAAAVSGIFVFAGFRHNNSIFAFAFAFSILLLVVGSSWPSFVGRIVAYLAPSMLSVYLLHMPFWARFTEWEAAIRGCLGAPHSVCQFVLALLVFMGAVCLDVPRRLAVALLRCVCRRFFGK